MMIDLIRRCLEAKRGGHNVKLATPFSSHLFYELDLLQYFSSKSDKIEW